MIRPTNLITFTNQIMFFGFQSQGQASGTGTVSGGGQFIISGMGMTEQFVTNGSISALNVSYTINPLSRRTM